MRCRDASRSPSRSEKAGYHIPRWCGNAAARPFPILRGILMRGGTAFSALLLIFALPAPATAGPSLLFEVSNGKVLFAEEADNHWYPASLTKLMTAYIAFGELKAGKLALKQKISCSDRKSTR